MADRKTRENKILVYGAGVPGTACTHTEEEIK